MGDMSEPIQAWYLPHRVYGKIRSYKGDSALREEV